MSDFNYPESKGPKAGKDFSVSSFLGSDSYKGTPIAPSGAQEVGEVSNSEVSLGTHANKSDSIG